MFWCQAEKVNSYIPIFETMKVIFKAQSMEQNNYRVM